MSVDGMRAEIAAAVFTILSASASAQSFDERIAACLACHGDKGTSQTPDVPSLGGQPAGYLLIQLYVFREKLRPVPVMNEQTSGFSDDDLRRYSDFIAKLPPPQPDNETADPALMARGKALVAQHRCGSCHAPDLAGQDQLPRLAGQREDYLVKSLRAYKSNERPGYDPAMASVVAPLKDDDLLALAAYLARLR
jgi:cytochrome c553